MINEILKTSKSDAQLERLLEKVQEYAQVYLLAKKRQKGCNGMGEVTTLREEFKDVIAEMIEYCKKKNHVAEDISYDIDLIIDEFERMTKT